jgi:hypothetical protein
MPRVGSNQIQLSMVKLFWRCCRFLIQSFAIVSDFGAGENQIHIAAEL